MLLVELVSGQMNWVVEVTVVFAFVEQVAVLPFGAAQTDIGLIVAAVDTILAV